MKSKKLDSLDVDQLVARFVDIAVAQGEALFRDEVSKFNRLYGQMQVVKEELRQRPGDQRTALLPLYNHPNTQVRMKAATATLAIAPDEARQILETIAASRQFPLAGHAGMTLVGLDNGTFKPT